jgi:hypothetical protein
MSCRSLLGLTLLSLLITLLNAAKPLVVDDNVYFYYAQQIAVHPLDPYGFQLQGGVPANHILAPPGLLYWWAGAMALFGQNPILWKLSLWPLVLILVLCLHAVARRYAPGAAGPLVCLIALSPAFLPGLNLMLDLPALALSLLAVLLYFRACERGSLSLALLAGLIAGLAAQTKYTGFLAPAVMLLHGGLFRKLRYAVAAVLLAGLLFTGWEAWIACRYGESHFLYALRERSEGAGGKLLLLLPLAGILGSTAPAGVLLGLTALGCSRRLFTAAVAAIVVGYLLIALVPERANVLLTDPRSGKTVLNLNSLIFGTFGLSLLVVTVAIIGRLARQENVDNAERRTDLFLILWLGLELLGYLTLTPYPAVRRVLGVFVVGALLSGRLAVRTGHAQAQRGLFRAAAVVSAVLGLLYFAIDFHHFHAEKVAVERLAEKLHRSEPRGRLWYLGNGGFEFYAERLGIRWLGYAGQLGPHDRIVVLSARSHMRVPPHPWLQGARPLRTWKIAPLFPLRTFMCYYYGRTALEHHEGSVLEVTVYQAPGG